MSNLWKALRDVSRGADPTVGFEPPAQGSGAGNPASDGRVSDRATAATVEPDWHPEESTTPSAPVPFEQTDLSRRPVSMARPRPPQVSPDGPPDRSAPPASPIRRAPVGGTLKFATPPGSARLLPSDTSAAPVAPVEYPAPAPALQPLPMPINGARDEPRRSAAASAPSRRTWAPQNGTAQPSFAASAAPELPVALSAGPDAGWAAASPDAPTTAPSVLASVLARSLPRPALVPDPDGAESVPAEQVPADHDPEPPVPAAPVLASRVPAAHVATARVAASRGGPASASGPAGFGRSGPSRPAAAAAFETPFETPAPQGVPGVGPAPAPPFRMPSPSPSPDQGAPDATANTPEPGGSNGRRPAFGAGVATPSRLPEALRAFAPGTPDLQMEVAAVVGSPRWKPGDDDVMPSDGRHTIRRPRLRDHLPW